MLERMQFLHPHLEDGAAPALMAGAMSQAQENAAPQEADSAPSAQERFDELIRGEFKDAYQAKMQAALDRRFKQARATEERMKALEPEMCIRDRADSLTNQRFVNDQRGLPRPRQSPIRFSRLY